MRKAGIFLVLCLLPPAGIAAAYSHPVEIANPALRAPFKEYLIKRADGSDLHFFVACSSLAAHGIRPLIVYLDGSGCNSQFLLRSKKLFSTNYGVLAEEALPSAIVAAPEKYGVPFGYEGKGGSGENCPAKYTCHATFNQRVEDAVLLIRALKPAGDAGRILLIGHSEGALVSAGAAAAEPSVTDVAFLSGSGASQMFDFIALRRKQMTKSGKSAGEIEAAVEELEKCYRDILAEPDRADKFFMGHAYKRWSGYFAHSGAELLAKTRARLFLAHGSEDANVPVESFDFLVSELLRFERKDITIRRFPGRGHDLRDPRAPVSEPPGTAVFREILRWFAEHQDRNTQP